MREYEEVSTLALRLGEIGVTAKQTKGHWFHSTTRPAVVEYYKDGSFSREFWGYEGLVHRGGPPVSVGGFRTNPAYTDYIRCGVRPGDRHVFNSGDYRGRPSGMYWTSHWYKHGRVYTGPFYAAEELGSQR